MTQFRPGVGVWFVCVLCWDHTFQQSLQNQNHGFSNLYEIRITVSAISTKSESQFQCFCSGFFFLSHFSTCNFFSNCLYLFINFLSTFCDIHTHKHHPTHVYVNALSPSLRSDPVPGWKWTSVISKCCPKLPDGKRVTRLKLACHTWISTWIVGRDRLSLVLGQKDAESRKRNYRELESTRLL